MKLSLAALAVLPLFACSVQPESSASTEDALLGDVASSKQQPDGTFDVTCKDGTVETRVPVSALLGEQVCNGSPSANIWDASSCVGTQLTESAALRWFSSDAPVVIGTYRVAARTRRCTAGAGCTAWQPRSDLPFVQRVRVQSGPIVDIFISDVVAAERTGQIVLSFVNGGRASHQGIKVELVAPRSSFLDEVVTMESAVADPHLLTPSKYAFYPSLSPYRNDELIAGIQAGRGDRDYPIPSANLGARAIAPGLGPEPSDGVLTDHCLRIPLSGRDQGADAEAVFYASFGTPPP